MRTIFLALFWAWSAVSACADADRVSLALAAIDARNYALAAKAEAEISNATARDVVIWARLRARQGSFADYVSFLDRNADWPGLPLLRERGEGNIPEDAGPATIIRYFEPQSPRSGIGSLRLAAALAASGNSAAAEAEIIRAWTTMALTATQFEAMLANHGPILADHHIVRLDNLLWDGEEGSARQMESLVPEEWRVLAEARMALRASLAGVDRLIEAVPQALRNDPGLAYERFLWRMNATRWDSAGDLMLDVSTSAEALGRPLAWAWRRSSLARDVMRDGDLSRAYAIASSHHVRPEEHYGLYSDLEWIAGYTALRLGKAEQAITHFTNFRSVVFSPISVGRAGYWLGRAHEAAGDMEAAAEAYALGAEYQSGFYGQLAAERGGLPMDPSFLADERFADWRRAPFLGSSVFHAALVFYEAGRLDQAERFLTHLAERLSRAEAGQLADLAFDLGNPHIALMIAKRAARMGHEIMRAYYPVTDLAEAELAVPPVITLSIARRESEFDPDAISPAGALGLMQVMPNTGREQADRMGLDFRETHLRSDLDYNAILGTGYLAHLSEEFGANPVLLAAAYNAGPSRARDWIKRFGDPRDPNVDVIDWIEAVPFAETRDYIMRVTESLAIYEAQLTGELPVLALTARLRAP